MVVLGIPTTMFVMREAWRGNHLCLRLHGCLCRDILHSRDKHFLTPGHVPTLQLGPGVPQADTQPFALTECGFSWGRGESL